MAMEYFQVNLPKTFLPFINRAKGQDIDAKVKVSLAIGMFAEKQVTLARAAELAEMPLEDFIDLLKSKNLPWMEYTEEHLQDDRQAISELMSSKEENDG
ncbi:UPF0175 family protein [Siminovitchia fortis]|uniref:UPF0175 family protein n=1 Tax=Siminovitchia fortis TaxID=254758 RepID=UPI001FD27AF1|nr:UPF0175 family protein [Siminovitchia fortis]